MTQPNPNSGSSKWTGNTNGPVPQRPNWQSPAGQQWGQPAPQQPQRGQPTTPGSVFSSPKHNRIGWFYIGTMLATLATTFLPVFRLTAQDESIGFLSATVNWWFRYKFSTPLAGEALDALIQREMRAEFHTELTLYSIALVLFILLQGLVAYCAFKGRRKTGGVIGVALYIIQLLVGLFLVAASFYAVDPSLIMTTESGLWLWIIIAVVGLVVSIRLLFKRNKNQQPPQNWGGPQAPQALQQFQQPQAPQQPQPNNWGQPGYQWGQPGN